MSETVTFVCIASSVWNWTVGNVHAECRSHRTHVENVKDPVEVQPPARDCLFVVLCVEHPRDPISFAPLDNVPLDLSHSPAIWNFVSESLATCVAGSTHVVNCTIASNTD